MSNNATSFKPYDPSKINGDTTPNLPAPAGDDGDDCGGLGQILLVVIAVVVTIATQGAALQLFAGAGGVAGASTGAVVASYAAGAAVGSIVSQAVGVATGIQQEFNWKGVALAAIAGGVGAGIGNLAGGGGLLGGTGLGGTIVRAAVGNALTQGIAVVTGLQQKFDWRGVAASAAGAGVGHLIGNAFNAGGTSTQAANSQNQWASIEAFGKAS